MNTGLWINSLLPIKIINTAWLLLAAFMFSHHLPRREHFVLRLIFWSMTSIALAAAIPVLNDSLLFVSSIFLVCYIMAPLAVRFCHKASWSTVCFMGAAAFAVDHIASMLDSIISLNFPDLLNYVDTGHMSVPIIINYIGCRLLVYALADYRLIRKNKDLDTDAIGFAPTFMIMIISLVINLYLNLVFSNLVPDKTYWMSFFVYLMNILISLLLLFCQFAMVRENRMRAQLQVESLLREQAKAQYRISKENIDAISIKCHDLKHQLLAVKNVIDPHEYNEIMEMINSYGAEIQTNNEVLDVVFQEKNFQCRKLGIQFTCIIDGKALDFIGTTDLYVLFGNLIDNAIEAVSKLPENEIKNIQVNVRRDRGFVIVTIENSYTGELAWSEGRLITSKSDKRNHGYGIRSIEKIVHKYNGRYSISTEDHIFSMNIVFPAGMQSS